jgi:hypothetical protein
MEAGSCRVEKACLPDDSQRTGGCHRKLRYAIPPFIVKPLAKLIIVSLIISVARASSGDEAFPFISCMDSCTRCHSPGRPNHDVCSPLCNENKHESKSFSILETLFRWTCVSDCQYRCMWAIEGLVEEGRAQNKRPVQKYFGKWPFIRILGMQEPASVLFSLLNLAANAFCLVKVAGLRVKKTAELHPTRLRRVLWTLHFSISCNAWLWSSVFHSRDTWITERLDYFSAGILVSYDLFLTLALVFNIDSNVPALMALGSPIAWVTLRHLYRMYAVMFDYGLHVKLCIAAGLLQTLAWLFWALRLRRGRYHPGKRYLITFIIAVNLSMALEIFDFPPIAYVVDAHSLWHAATAPLTIFWLLFVLEDIKAHKEQVSISKTV